MEACIAKDGCKGYISAGSCSRWMVSCPFYRLGGPIVREVFFSSVLFIFFACIFRPLPFSYRLYSLVFWFVFIQQKIAGWLAVEYRGKGAKGCWGPERWDVVLFPHFFFTFIGPRPSPHLPEGVQRGHSRQEHWEGDDC